MEVVVLAGGMGTRLKSVVSNVPKPMAPVNDQPFLKYLLTWLSKYNVSSIIISVGFMGNVIEDYFGDSFNNIPISYTREDKPLGTGGGILLALNAATHDNVVVINGDTYFPIDLDQFSALHIQHGGQVTVALKKMTEFDRYGTVEFEGGDVKKFNEKKHCKAGVINGGIYAINKSRLNLQGLPDVFSFETEVLEKLAGTGNLKGAIYDEPFIDIGIPKDYKKAINFL